MEENGQRRDQVLNKDIYPEQDLEKRIVGWEGQNDPENPRYTSKHLAEIVDGKHTETILPCGSGPSWAW